MVPKLFTRSAFVIPAIELTRCHGAIILAEETSQKPRNEGKLTDARVGDGERVVGLVGGNVNVELRVALQDALVREALETDLVQCI